MVVALVVAADVLVVAAAEVAVAAAEVEYTGPHLSMLWHLSFNI